MVILLGILFFFFFKTASTASLFNIKRVERSPKSGVLTERSNRAKAANADTRSHSGLF